MRCNDAAVLELLRRNPCRVTRRARWRRPDNAAADGADRSFDPRPSVIPSNLRRRVSLLGRASILVAEACLADRGDGLGGGPFRSVFASRHGEGSTTVDLLGAVAGGEPLSPLSFSRSVHNTSSGLFTISVGNTSNSTAVAGGRDTFAAGFLETVLRVAEEDGPVLFVTADELLPPVYERFRDEPPVAYAVALLVSRAERREGEDLVNRYEAAAAPDDGEPHALRFLRESPGCGLRDGGQGAGE